MDNKKSILTKFSELSFLHKLLLFLGITCCAVGGYWYFVLDEKLTTITRLTQTADNLAQEIDRYRMQVAKLPELEQNLDLQKKELYYAMTLLPEDARALESLLASFERLGRDEHVEFILFQPGPEQMADFYATRSVQLQISGTFHRLLTYFDRLSRLERLVTIQDVTFSPKSDFSPTEKYLQVNLVLQVYRALTETEIKAREEEQKKQAKK